VVEGTVRKRYKDLTEKGIFRVRAFPDLQKLGFNLIGFMGLQVQMADLRAIMNELSQKPNICFLTYVTGRWDLIAVIAARTPKELGDFIQREISKLPGVLRTETLITLEIIKGGQQGLDTRQLLDSVHPKNLRVGNQCH
jgi:Lrp/AsnC family transcriptional regulator, regulator for asnA, asnC and gidA